MRAVWLTNSSGLTLDAGSFNIIDDNTFAGEGVMDLVKPGERRLLSYAADQAVRVDSTIHNDKEKITRVRMIKGVMTRTTETRTHVQYRVRNEDGKSRVVIIEHPVDPEQKLVGTAKPEETSASEYRFRVPVEAHSSANFVVEAAAQLHADYQITNIDDNELALLVEQKALDPQMEQALREVVKRKHDVNHAEEEIASRNERLTGIEKDQQRLRENMKALKGSAEERLLLQRYARQLNAEEDQLAAIHAEVARLQTAKDKASDELEHFIESISLEAVL
jgi:hypothetical protein